MPIESVADLTVPESLQRRNKTPPSQDLDRSSFMKLLVAELKHQDPLEPLEARELVTQLSQLTSVERLINIEEGVAGLAAETAGMASTQLVSLVGHQVTANPSSVSLGANGAASGAFFLEREAASVEISIRDGNGQLLRTLSLDAMQPGAHNFTWDGNDDGGNRQAAGRYGVEVVAKDDAGQRVPASTEVSGVVTEVSYDNGVPEVVIGSTRVPFGEITSIAQ